MIKHLLGQFKKPSKVRIYEAVARVKELKRLWKSIAFRHAPRELNKVADDMGRRARDAGMDVIFWDGSVPEDAPPN